MMRISQASGGIPHEMSFGKFMDVKISRPLDKKYERISWLGLGDAKRPTIVVAYPPCGAPIPAVYEAGGLRSAFQKLGDEAFLVQAAFHTLSKQQGEKPRIFVADIEGHRELGNNGVIIVMKYTQFGSDKNFVYGSRGVPGEKDKGVLVASSSTILNGDAKRIADALVQEGHANVIWY